MLVALAKHIPFVSYIQSIIDWLVLEQSEYKAHTSCCQRPQDVCDM